MAVQNTICSNDPVFQRLSCSNIDIAEGIEVETIFFLFRNSHAARSLPCLSGQKLQAG